MSLSLQSRRGRRIARLVAAPSAVCAALILAAVAPAAADASCPTTSGGSTGVVCTFSLTPSSTAAGGNPTIASSVSFDYGTSTTDSVKSLSITLPPGLFASLGAVTQVCTTPELTSLVPQCPPASLVGTGSLVDQLGGLKLNLNVSLYLMAAPVSTDAAGIGVVVTSPQNLPITTTTGTVTEQEINGNPVLVLSLPTLPNQVDGISIGQVQSLSFSINGVAATATGTPSSTPFTRLPTNCVTATSTLSVQTYAATSANGASSSSFTPTGCSSLTFTPTMTATATKDTSDPGVTLVTTVSTNPSQAANKTLVLTVPTATLAPDVFNAGHLFGQQIGTAQAVTPLVTTPLIGTVTLTGTIGQPALTITFPPPFSLQFSGTIDILANSVTFSTVPDVPLNSLTLTLQGNATSLFYTTCSQPNGTLQADFGGQNGATSNVTTPLSIIGCPKPVVATASKTSVGGLKKGTAKLSFSLAAGNGSPNLTSFTVALPKGLSFTKKTFKKGLSLSGAKVASASLKGGKLVVKLKASVTQLGVKLSAKALTESSSLKAKVKAGKVSSLSATVTATNASGGTLGLKLKLSI